MAGIINDTANTGYGGNYGGAGGYYGGSNWTDLAALALVTGGFGFGGRHGDYGDRHEGGYYKTPCCAPATCEQVNDVDRDVLKCAFDIEKGQWDVDRDVLLSSKDIKEDICHSTHKLEKDIWDTDKDVLIGFKDTDHKIDMLKCETKEGFAEVKGLIKETCLMSELRDEKRYSYELARKLEKADDTILKKDIVSEILAALCATPVIANK